MDLGDLANGSYVRVVQQAGERSTQRVVNAGS